MKIETRGRKPLPCPDRSMLGSLVIGGASLLDLVDHFEVGPRPIHRWLRELGVTLGPRPQGGIYTSRHRLWQETSTQAKIDAMFPPERRARFWSLVTTGEPNECWPWKGSKNVDGYGSWGFQHRSFRSHRVAYMLAKGPVPADLHVMHSCNTRLCCNPAHLDAGTIQENMRHREAKGNPAKGMRCGRRKLRADEVYAIRESDEHPNVLGKRYGVHPTTIGVIRQRKKWRSLPERDPVTKEIVVETSGQKSE